MQKVVAKLAMVGALFCILTVAQAKTVTFNPNPLNLWDLDHSYYYSWGVKCNVPKNEQIISAVIEFKNINNWANEKNVLFVDLLDNPKVGVNKYKDTGKDGDDAYAGKGLQIGKYVDNDYKHSENYIIDFNAAQLATLNNYAKDGLFGFGIDPDCHYYNDGITLTIKTGPTRVPQTPEPSSLLTGILGLGSFGLLKFRKR